MSTTTKEHWTRNVIDYQTGETLSGGASAELCQASDENFYAGGNGVVQALMQAGLWVPAPGDPRAVSVWVEE